MHLDIRGGKKLFLKQFQWKTSAKALIWGVALANC